MGVNGSNDISSESTTQMKSQKFMFTQELLN